MTTLLLACGFAAAALAQGGPTSTELDLETRRLTYDEPGDGQLWVRGENFKASFGPGGASFVPFLGSGAPKNYPVHLRLAGASLGNHALDLTPSAVWSRAGDTVTLDRGPVDVRYHVAQGSLEQTFRFDELPVQGDLVVRVALTSELIARADAAGGFVLENDRGGVRYGAATVLDAGGRSLGVESELVGGVIAIRVPEAFLADAQLPVVVDPLITTFSIATNTAHTALGGVVFNSESGYFVAAIESWFSATDSDVLTVLRTPGGAFVPASSVWIDLTSDDWSWPSIGANADANNVLVTATTGAYPNRTIEGRVRYLPGFTMTPQFDVGGLFAGEKLHSSVGGDPVSSNYLVAWQRSLPGSESDIHYRLVASNGTLVGTGTGTLANAQGVYDSTVHVSTTNGTGPNDTRAWNIVWERHNGGFGNDIDIMGAQITPQGALQAPAFIVDSRAGNDRSPRASSPLFARTGLRDWLVVYANSDGPGGSEIRGRLLHGTGFLSNADVTDLEIAVVGSGHVNRAQRYPDVATDGSQFIITYSEAQQGSLFDDRLYATSLFHLGQSVGITEARELLAADSTHKDDVHAASMNDGGEYASQRVMFGWTGQASNLADRDVFGGIYDSPNGFGLLGSAYCPQGAVNSSGYQADLQLFGLASLAANQLFLDVDDLPDFQFGYFLCSLDAGQQSVGSGWLCLGGSIKRLNHEVLFSGPFGAVGLLLDFNTLPAGVAYSAGEQWHFQYWTRDGNSSNFSNALRLTFQ